MLDWPIHELLPHAGEMILLDHVVAFDHESLQASVTIAAKGLFNQADGSLPAWVGIEIMAQGIAAFAGCHARQAGNPAPLGFLLGSRQYQCSHPAIPAGTPLSLEVKQSLRDDNGMGVFECRLSNAIYCLEARLNVFQPPHIEQYLQEASPQGDPA